MANPRDALSDLPVLGVKVVVVVVVTMLTLNRRSCMLKVCFWRNIMAVRRAIVPGS